MSELLKQVKGYTMVPNSILNNEELSLKAKGLWAFINSKPDGWQFSAERIFLQSKDGIDSVKSALLELENMGLLSREKSVVNGKISGWKYILKDDEKTGFSIGGKTTGGKTTGGKATDISDTIYSKKDIVKKKEEKESIKKEKMQVSNKKVEGSLVSINWEYIKRKMIEDKTSEDYADFIIGEYQSKEFLDIWEKFVSYRKMIKKPLVLEDQQTYHVLQLCKNGKWFKTSIAILELIIAKNWQWYKDEWIVNCGVTLPERPYMGETEEEFTEEELAEAEEKIKNAFKK